MTDPDISSTQTASADDLGGPGRVPRVVSETVEGRRGEILDAALAVFAERGYEGGTMRDVAALVGVSEPALYRYFPSKEAMFLELMDVVAGRMRDETFALIDQAHAAAFRSQLIGAVADRRQAIARYGPALRTILIAAAHNPAFLENYRRTIITPVRDRLMATAERLDAEFGLTDGDADRAARVRTLISIFIGTFVTSAVLGDAPDEASADAVMRIMRWG